MSNLDELVEKMAERHQQPSAVNDQHRHARMRARTLASIERPSRTATPAWGRMLAGTMAAVAVAVVVTWGMLRPVPLTFETRAHPGYAQSHALIVAEDESIEVVFSEGSVVRLRPRTRLRVGADHDNGVDLVLESGGIDVTVVADSVTAWRVEAGPYHVSLTGASIAAQWREDAGIFEIEPQLGRAMVRGPHIEGTRALDAGERLVIETTSPVVAVPAVQDERISDLVVSDPVDLVETDAEPDLEDSESGAGPRSRTGRQRGHNKRPQPEPPKAAEASWRELVRAGSYKQAMRAAEAAGFSRLCATVDSGALLELADVGRYTRRPARAKEALLALRRRFPGTNDAAKAAFDLGRLVPRRGGHCRESTKWFRVYLRERPTGSMTDAASRRIEECVTEAKRETDPKP